MTDISQLNDRAREIFRQLVDQYLQTGEPVGSRTLAKIGGLNLSPASIRNVMQDLEELGLLSAPHASAGRQPTETGLRLFVDGMMQVTSLGTEERQRIEWELKPGGKRMEDVFGEASGLLSGLSACAGLVMVAKQDVPIRQIDFVPLTPERVLAILVGQDGSVENRVIELPMGVPPAALVQAGNYINTRLAGLTLEEARARLDAEVAAKRAELDVLAAAVASRGLGVWASEGAERDVLIVRGQANLIEGSNAAQDLERLRRLLEDIETKKELARVLDMARDSAAMRIFIGAESRLFSLSGSSVIAAPFKDQEDHVIGVIGVIGPTRLNYARIVPMVDFTARALERLIRPPA
jgi:heat-inducible transcriptional repressor